MKPRAFLTSWLEPVRLVRPVPLGQPQQRVLHLLLPEPLPRRAWR